MSDKIDVKVPVTVDLQFDEAQVGKFVDSVRDQLSGAGAGDSPMAQMLLSGNRGAGTRAFKKDLDDLQSSFNAFKGSVARGPSSRSAGSAPQQRNGGAKYDSLSEERFRASGDRGRGRYRSHDWNQRDRPDFLRYDKGGYDPSSRRPTLGARVRGVAGALGARLRGTRSEMMNIRSSAPMTESERLSRMQGRSHSGLAASVNAAYQGTTVTLDKAAARATFDKSATEKALNSTGIMASLKHIGVKLKGAGNVIAEKMAPFASKMKGGARRAGGMLARGAGMAGMAGVMGLGAMLTGAYSEGMAAGTSTELAKLQATQTLGSGATLADSSIATRFGYKQTEAIGLQTQAAKQGFNAKTASQQADLFRINRTLGNDGIQVAGGMMRRGGEMAAILPRLSKIVAMGMETGLDRARIPEMLQSANEYAERQIAITPGGTEMADRFAQLMSRFQTSGVKGFQGKYGANVINKFDGAIKNSSGAKEAFTLRAMGFGAGTSLYDAKKMQQEGALGVHNGKLNIDRIVDQSNKEMGTGQAGNMALADYAGISYAAVEKLRGVLGSGTDVDTKKAKIKAIQMKESERSMPLLQAEAFKSMVAFGTEAVRNAKRFDRMAAQLDNLRPIKEAMDKMQNAMLNVTIPLLQVIGKVLVPLANGLSALMKGFEAFGPAFSNAKSGALGLGKIQAGMGAFGNAVSQSYSMSKLQGAMAEGDGEGYVKLWRADKEMKNRGTDTAKVNFNGTELTLNRQQVADMIEQYKQFQAQQDAKKAATKVAVPAPGGHPTKKQMVLTGKMRQGAH